MYRAGRSTVSGCVRGQPATRLAVLAGTRLLHSGGSSSSRDGRSTILTDGPHGTTFQQRSVSALGTAAGHSGMEAMQQVALLQDEVRRRDVVIADLKARILDLEKFQPTNGEARSSRQQVTRSGPRCSIVGLPYTTIGTRVSAAFPLSSSTTTPTEQWYPSHARIVRTSAEFLNAIEEHASDIAIVPGSHICLPYGARIRSSVTLYGVPPAGSLPTQGKQRRADAISNEGGIRRQAPPVVVEANLSIVGARASFRATGITFEASTPSEPVIHASNGAHVMLRDCTVASGRDGVYLSSKASVDATSCRFRRNVRGIFQSLWCRASATDCAFDGNTFHLVLLSPPLREDDPTTDGSASRRPADEVYASGNSFLAGRCDVVQSYNPVQDRYEECVRNQQAVVLTEEESTAGLVDCTW